MGTGLVMDHVVAVLVSVLEHRARTHDSIEVNPIVDKVGSAVRFCLTGVSKEEWVGTHKIHHKFADKP